MLISLRKNGVPKDVTIVSLQNSAPEGFVAESTLHDKFLRQVPNSCTNPGSSGGSSSHTHASSGAHTHSAPSSHTHNLGTNSTDCPVSDDGCFGSTPSGLTHTSTHSHSKTSNSSGGTESTSPDGGHTQSSTSHEPEFKKFATYKKNSLVSIRKNDVPLDSILFWTKNSSIPSTFVNDTSNLDKFIKIITNDCDTRGSLGGASSHTHPVDSSHSHTISGSAHSHSFTGNIGNSPPAGSQTNAEPSPLSIATTTHHHGTLANLNPSSICETVDSSSTHCHGTGSQNPSHITTKLIVKNNFSIRKRGIPKGSSVIWTNTLSSIPSGFALNDGTLGTTNVLGKMLKIIPTSCATPGSSSGSDTHQHGSSGDHPHSVPNTHSHPHPAPTTPIAQSGLTSPGPSPFSTKSRTGHTHDVNASSGAGTSFNTCPSGTHQHAGDTNLPTYIEVAFIEKI